MSPRFFFVCASAISVPAIASTAIYTSPITNIMRSATQGTGSTEPHHSSPRWRSDPGKLMRSSNGRSAVANIVGKTTRAGI